MSHINVQSTILQDCEPDTMACKATRLKDVKRLQLQAEKGNRETEKDN